MLVGQRAALVEIEASLGDRLDEAAGTDLLLLRFRLETTRAAGRFVDGLLERLPLPDFRAAASPPPLVLTPGR